MTTTEAIKQLQTEHDLIAGERELDGSQFAPALLEALAMAIEVLRCSEIPNSSDTISRQAALDAMDTWDKFGCDPDGKLVRYDDDEHYIPYVRYEDMVHAIKHLPAAQPQRMRGKWSFAGDNMFECTCCHIMYTAKQLDGLRNYNTDPYVPKFCPNCGADTRGEQDG